MGKKLNFSNFFKKFGLKKKEIEEKMTIYIVEGRKKC